MHPWSKQSNKTLHAASTPSLYRRVCLFKPLAILNYFTNNSRLRSSIRRNRLDRSRQCDRFSIRIASPIVVFTVISRDKKGVLEKYRTQSNNRNRLEWSLRFTDAIHFVWQPARLRIESRTHILLRRSKRGANLISHLRWAIRKDHLWHGTRVDLLL